MFKTEKKVILHKGRPCPSPQKKTKTDQKKKPSKPFLQEHCLEMARACSVVFKLSPEQKNNVNNPSVYTISMIKGEKNKNQKQQQQQNHDPRMQSNDVQNSNNNRSYFCSSLAMAIVDVTVTTFGLVILEMYDFIPNALA